MSEKAHSRLSSKDPADRAWRLEQARVDSAIEGMERSPILDAYVAQLEEQGCSDEEIILRVAAFDLDAASKAAE